jgi:hypothetical protein
MLQNVRDVKARLAWHKQTLTFITGQDNSEFASNVPLLLLSPWLNRLSILSLFIVYFLSIKDLGTVQSLFSLL